MRVIAKQFGVDPGQRSGLVALSPPQASPPCPSHCGKAAVLKFGRVHPRPLPDQRELGTGGAADENSSEICMASNRSSTRFERVLDRRQSDLWRAISLRAYPLMVRGRSIEVHGAEMYSGLRQDLGMILEEAVS